MWVSPLDLRWLCIQEFLLSQQDDSWNNNTLLNETKRSRHNYVISLNIYRESFILLKIPMLFSQDLPWSYSLIIRKAWSSLNALVGTTRHIKHLISIRISKHCILMLMLMLLLCPLGICWQSGISINIGERLSAHSASTWCLYQPCPVCNIIITSHTHLTSTVNKPSQWKKSESNWHLEWKSRGPWWYEESSWGGRVKLNWNDQANKHNKTTTAKITL